jgi:hypothetical protein
MSRVLSKVFPAFFNPYSGISLASFLCFSQYSSHKLVTNSKQEGTLHLILFGLLDCSGEEVDEKFSALIEGEISGVGSVIVGSGVFGWSEACEVPDGSFSFTGGASTSKSFVFSSGMSALRA